MPSDFFQTFMGRKFYEGDVPRIAKALERIAAALEKLAEQGRRRRLASPTSSLSRSTRRAFTARSRA